MDVSITLSQTDWRTIVRYLDAFALDLRACSSRRYEAADYADTLFERLCESGAAGMLPRSVSVGVLCDEDRSGEALGGGASDGVFVDDGNPFVVSEVSRFGRRPGPQGRAAQVQTRTCWRCAGTRFVFNEEVDDLEDCSVCHGSGVA